MEPTKADREMVAEMQAILEQESRKPAAKRDYALIEQLSEAIYEATSNEDLSAIAEKNILLLAEKSSEKNHRLRQIRRMRPAAVLAACAMLCLGLNFWTLHALGTNLPETIYQLTKGGISLRPDDFDSSVIKLEPAEDDPYGIQAECKKLGFSPLTPAFLPEGMQLRDLNTDDAKIKTIQFAFKGSKQTQLHLLYKFAEKQQDYDSINFGFPSDHYQFHEEMLGGYKVLISWEDEVFHAAFCDKEAHIIYHIASNHIGYDESYRVLCSYFE